MKIDSCLDFIQYLLYPETCILCGAQGADHRDLCRPCYQDLPFNRHACPGCASPLAAEAATLLCGHCLRKKPLFQNAYTGFHYHNPISELLCGLKYQGKLTYAKLLGQLLAEELRYRAVPLPQLIIPVPLHTERLRKRGFNQALELARPLSQQLQIPLANDVCQRIRATPKQTNLALAKRKSNLRGAFQVIRKPQQTHVAILDDVFTTGTTVTELSRVLQQAGVQEISVWACARTSLRR